MQGLKFQIRDKIVIALLSALDVKDYSLFDSLCQLFVQMNEGEGLNDFIREPIPQYHRNINLDTTGFLASLDLPAWVNEKRWYKDSGTYETT